MAGVRFGFQRGTIIALCQNASPGMMAGKEGLAAERARVDQAYREGGEFAILHDLTNCLRIGDVAVFGNDGTSETLEIKTDPGRRSQLKAKNQGRSGRCAQRRPTAGRQSHVSAARLGHLVYNPPGSAQDRNCFSFDVTLLTR